MCHGHAATQENCYALQATVASRGRVHWSRDLSVSYASHAATSSTRCFSFVPPGSCGTVCAGDRKSTRLNSSHGYISYSFFFFIKKKGRYTAGTPAGYQCVQHYQFPPQQLN